MTNKFKLGAMVRSYMRPGRLGRITELLSGGTATAQVMWDAESTQLCETEDLVRANAFSEARLCEIRAAARVWRLDDDEIVALCRYYEAPFGHHYDRLDDRLKAAINDIDSGKFGRDKDEQ